MIFSPDSPAIRTEILLENSDFGISLIVRTSINEIAD